MNNSIKFGLFLFFLLFIMYLIYLSFQDRFSFGFLKFNFKNDQGFKSIFNLFDVSHLKLQNYVQTTSKIVVKTTTSATPKKEDTKIQKDNEMKKIEEKKPTEKEIVPPLGFEKKDLSPYYQKISFSFYRGYNSNQSFDKIVVLNKELEKVEISGWYFKTKRGLLFIIPKGIKDFKINSFIEYSDIILEKNEQAEIYWGYNQTGIKNFNLKLNKCTGYLNNFYKFSPLLPKNCPKVEINDLVLLSGKCQNFLRNLPACYQPTSQDINEFAFDPNCLKYFDKFNYLSCYEAHKKDSDFFGKTWRVYIKPDNEVFDFNLDKIHDRIMLFDKNNLLVNIYDY